MPYFFRKIGKMSEDLSSTAFVIGILSDNLENQHSEIWIFTVYMYLSTPFNLFCQCSKSNEYRSAINKVVRARVCMCVCVCGGGDSSLYKACYRRTTIHQYVMKLIILHMYSV